MKHTHAKRRQSLAARPSAFKLHPVAGACAALMFVAASASAQQAVQPAPADSSAQPTTITVTGIRRGIENAISSKKDSDMIVETISSEDLGKLPDDSIADALSTLPGVAAQVIGGRSATLNVRGLSGDFISTLFNGRTQASVGDNRAVFFDQYPAELINAASVYKTPDAELVGQGLAATIDLKTLLPLDFNKQVMQFKAMGSDLHPGTQDPEVNSRGDRLSASYIDQFAGRTVGVALGYAHLDTPINDQSVHSWGIGGSPTSPAGVSANSIQGAEWWSDNSSSVRDGLMGVLQYKPNHDFSSTLDGYYSRSTQNDFNRGFQFGTNYSGVTSPTVNGNDFLTGGNNLQFGGGSAYSGAPVIRNDFDDEIDHISSIGWKNIWRQGDWTFTGDLSASTASEHQTVLETYSGATGPSYAGSFTANPFTGMSIANPSIDFSNPANVHLGDPGGWGQDGYVKYENATDSVRELRFDAKRSLDNGWFNSVAFGLDFNKREKTRNSPEDLVDLPGGPAVTAAIPSNLVVGKIALPGGPTILAYNGLAAIGSVYQLDPKIHGDIYAKDWTVDEKITTGYAQLNIDSSVGSIPLRGNLGLQFVHTSQSSDAVESEGGADPVPKDISAGASYSNALPSMNLVATLPDDQLLRFGLGQGIQRPRFDEMNASNEATFDLAHLLWTSNAGNPALRPTLSDNLDLSWEKYFGKKGYISVAPYYKYLKTYIYQEAEYYNFAGFPQDPGQPAPISPIGTATQWVNGTGGSEKGIELAVSMPFELLMPTLEGFGIQANVSRGSSSIQTNVGGQTSESALPGFSASVANTVLYYENGGFEIRYRESYRSTYLGEIQGFGANLAYSQFLGVHTSDLQASYEFKEGPMKGLTGLFQVFNMNNPTIIQTFGTNQGMSQSDRYGRTFLLGLNYKM